MKRLFKCLFITLILSSALSGCAAATDQTTKDTSDIRDMNMATDVRDINTKSDAAKAGGETGDGDTYIEAENGKSDETPGDNPKAGAVLRIGYSQVREYGGFAEVLLNIAREFVEEGSISADFLDKYTDVNYELHFEDGDGVNLWNDICDHNVEGAKYMFVREAFFDYSLMSDTEKEASVNRDDIDLAFAMGTAPGVYMHDNERKNKYMVMMAADPIASGIVQGETERDRDNSYAVVDNTIYERQLNAGFKFLKFEKLGMVYDNYDYAAIDEVKRMSQKLGFQLILKNVDEPLDDADFDKYYTALKEGYKELINEGVDTIYIPVSSIDYEEKMQDLLEDSIIPSHIKTLAQDDILPVVYGVLFGVTQIDDAELANHVVTELRRYAEKGVPFNQLDMVCECTPKIVMNYTTAKKIDFELSFEDFQLVDSIYW